MERLCGNDKALHSANMLRFQKEGGGVGFPASGNIRLGYLEFCKMELFM